jgi:hypothetical protein
MFRKALFLSIILVLTASLATAKTFTVRLHEPTTIENKQLKPGNYKVTLSEGNATITNGRETVETAVQTEENTDRFSATSVRYTDKDGKKTIREIRIGGTNTRVVFN